VVPVVAPVVPVVAPVDEVALVDEVAQGLAGTTTLVISLNFLQKEDVSQTVGLVVEFLRIARGSHETLEGTGHAVKRESQSALQILLKLARVADVAVSAQLGQKAAGVNFLRASMQD
jgi:hypothetical protein